MRRNIAPVDVPLPRNAAELEGHQSPSALRSLQRGQTFFQLLRERKYYFSRRFHRQRHRLGSSIV